MPDGLWLVFSSITLNRIIYHFLEFWINKHWSSFSYYKSRKGIPRILKNKAQYRMFCCRVPTRLTSQLSGLLRSWTSMSGFLLNLSSLQPIPRPPMHFLQMRVIPQTWPSLLRYLSWRLLSQLSNPYLRPLPQRLLNMWTSHSGHLRRMRVGGHSHSPLYLYWRWLLYCVQWWICDGRWP